MCVGKTTSNFWMHSWVDGGKTFLPFDRWEHLTDSSKGTWEICDRAGLLDSSSSYTPNHAVLVHMHDNHWRKFSQTRACWLNAEGLTQLSGICSSNIGVQALLRQVVFRLFKWKWRQIYNLELLENSLQYLETFCFLVHIRKEEKWQYCYQEDHKKVGDVLLSW